MGAIYGHDVCTASDKRWVEGVLPASPAAPLHPNARGLQLTQGIWEDQHALVGVRHKDGRHG